MFVGVNEKTGVLRHINPLYYSVRIKTRQIWHAVVSTSTDYIVLIMANVISTLSTNDLTIQLSLFLHFYSLRLLLTSSDRNDVQQGPVA